MILDSFQNDVNAVLVYKRVLLFHGYVADVDGSLESGGRHGVRIAFSRIEKVTIATERSVLAAA